MTGKLDGHRHSPGLLGGAFLWSGKGRQHRWWTAQPQGMIHVVLQWSAVSFLKEFLQFILDVFFGKDITWTISKLFHQHQNRNLRFPITYCGQLCQMLRWGQAWQGEWLSDYPCSVKYETVPSEVLFLCCGMVYKLIGSLVEAALCSYGHSTG